MVGNTFTWDLIIALHVCHLDVRRLSQALCQSLLLGAVLALALMRSEERLAGSTFLVTHQHFSSFASGVEVINMSGASGLSKVKQAVQNFRNLTRHESACSLRDCPEFRVPGILHCSC